MLSPKWIDRSRLTTLAYSGNITLRPQITFVGNKIYVLAERLLPSEHRAVSGLADSGGIGIYRSSNGIDWQGMDKGIASTDFHNGPAYLEGYGPGYPNSDLSYRHSPTLFSNPEGTKLYVGGRARVNTFTPPSTFEFYYGLGMYPFDLATEMWEPWDDFGFDMEDGWNDYYPFIGFRSNGDLIVAYQSGGQLADLPPGTPTPCVTVKKRHEGIWTTIAEFDPTDEEMDCQLMGACIDPDDNLHLMFARCLTYYDSPGVYDMYHASVSAIDSQSDFHLVYESLSLDYNLDGFAGILSCKNSQLGYAFQPMAGDNYPADGEFRFAIGDMTLEPLAPAWTTEEVSATHIPWSGDWEAWGAPYFDQGKWGVIFKSLYPYAHGAWASSPPRLWKVQRNGPEDWADPELIYTPVDSDDRWLSVCNEFRSGVGVLFDDYAALDKQLAYDGPNPAGGRSIVSYVY
jgi:hypothetical protein